MFFLKQLATNQLTLLRIKTLNNFLYLETYLLRNIRIFAPRKKSINNN